jgi:Flp pilus assembly protein TadB
VQHPADPPHGALLIIDPHNFPRGCKFRGLSSQLRRFSSWCPHHQDGSFNRGAHDGEVGVAPHRDLGELQPTTTENDRQLPIIIIIIIIIIIVITIISIIITIIIIIIIITIIICFPWDRMTER